MVREVEEEYELVPLSPIRRLEKRIEKLEASSGIDAREFLREIVDIIRMNQQLVDELAKANDALRIEISKLPGRLEELISNLNELLSYIKASASEATIPSEAFKPLIEKLDQLIEGNKKLIESNSEVISVLEEIKEKFKKPLAVPAPPPKILPPKPLLPKELEKKPIKV